MASLELPCNIGDTVYGIRKASYCPPGICRNKDGCDKCRERTPYEVYKKRFIVSDLEKMDKTIFLTQEQADLERKRLNKKVYEFIRMMKVD